MKEDDPTKLLNCYDLFQKKMGPMLKTMGVNKALNDIDPTF
jgi:hypothetical protein